MKRSFVSIVAVSTTVLLSLALLARAADTEKPKSDKPDVAHDPTHVVRWVMAQTADRSLSKNAIDGVLEMVHKPDRERIQKELTKKEDKNYQDLAEKVRKLWKDKYGHDFSAEGHVHDLKDLKVRFSGKGRDEKAAVDFPPEPGEGAYELHLVREHDTNYWRVELPDSVNGKNFYDNLAKSLQRVLDEKDKLPGSADKGYERVVTLIVHELAFPAGGSPAASK